MFVETITIMYGLGGHRGIVKTRVLSFSLYVMGLLTGVVTLPLVVAGPSLVRKVVPERLDFMNELYWPIVIVLGICFLATLYHVSVPVRTSWRFNLPGAALTMVIWIFGSFLLRWVLTSTAKGSTSIYGPLAAPIVVMLWLYLLSIAVLIGAALNAAFDRLWPDKETARARMEVVRKLRMKALIPRLRRDEEEQEQFADVTPRRGGDHHGAAGPWRGRALNNHLALRRPRPPYIPGVLDAIGFDTEIARWAERWTAGDASVGRVVRVDRGIVSVLTETGPHRVTIGGGLLTRMGADPLEGPCTGDWAMLRDWPDHRTTIEQLLPRRTAVVRAAAGKQSHDQVLCANVDVAAVVVALHPLPVMAKVERLVALAWESGARPLVVLTKADLVSDADQVAEDVAATVPGVDVVVVSTLVGTGADTAPRHRGRPADDGTDRRLGSRQVLADQHARRGRRADHPRDPRRRSRPAHVGASRAGAVARRRCGDRHPRAARRRAGRRGGRARARVRRRGGVRRHV